MSFFYDKTMTGNIKLKRKLFRMKKDDEFACRGYFSVQKVYERTAHN